ncbi:MAG: molecular chaperone DnaJ [Acidimicrobiales bacterium]|uniref:molecular chaperone DnaJ n=1 Tax=Candidatus Poriferisodalis multihospitum TaxID=2983191 RepID=UPI001385BD7A|nr:molecular chaperone DnaJ [Candidatus Poriferisodalis multihospitum]MDE0677064.1 molecular chaperone DnaJ [Acidimicrobiaceae bacterium]MYG62288.1 molecular chaperone DnaJ [Acidimicrobiales bacterium]MYJ46503.1 molecular chaperone DnaJ [Acidimicrobiales bacterium]
MPADYYELLEVSRDVSEGDLKRAYRQKAREHHPDANPGDGEAEARFKEISEAYAVLSDPEARARYDRFGHEGLRGGMGGPAFDFDLSDIFESFFGGNPFGGGRSRRASGPPRGDDHETVVDLDFAEAVFGVDRPIDVRTLVSCDDCGGSGAAEGTSPTVCSVCGGAGQVRQVRQSLLGQMVTTAPCGQCRGTGMEIIDPCGSCRGEGRRAEHVSLVVRVPPGVDSGATLRLSGRGSVGPRGGPAGDLYVHLRVAESDVFVRQGESLVAELPVTMLQAALGAKVTFETLDGPRELAVRAGTQPNDTIRLNGLGVPRANGRGRGDLHVVVRVDIPKKLSKSEVAKLREVASERGEQVDGIVVDRPATAESHDREHARDEARAERSKARGGTEARQRRMRRSKG